jgi:hypothetical protein
MRAKTDIAAEGTDKIIVKDDNVTGPTRPFAAGVMVDCHIVGDFAAHVADSGYNAIDKAPLFPIAKVWPDNCATSVNTVAITKL